MATSQRWRSLNELRAAYAASGLELARRHPMCRGKVRHETLDMAERHVAGLHAKDDEHDRRRARLEAYVCRWCNGYHVGHRPMAPGRRKFGRRIKH